MQLLFYKMGLYFWMLGIISIMSLLPISLASLSSTASFVCFCHIVRKKVKQGFLSDAENLA